MKSAAIEFLNINSGENYLDLSNETNIMSDFERNGAKTL
jgi:hypothetical protein